MSYNRFNNDLPVPPRGYVDWRAFYADSLQAFAALGDEMQPELARIVVPTGNGDLTEMPYWKIAHYAAREQAEETRDAPQLGIYELSEIRNYALSSPRQPSKTLSHWLEAAFAKLIRRP